ncbi:MAG: hypothetical protein J2P20_19630, partial [Pseudonocardia sp.]|nr:hypothetical protein [Pseudonocardia sp.]
MTGSGTTTPADATRASAGAGKPRATTPVSGSESGSRCYVLDTSVLLSDPWAVTRFDEHEVVLPLVVVSELEGKRHHPELGWFAREALRLLDDLRVRYGRLDKPVPVGDGGGTVRVELNHTDPEVLPSGFRTDTNDSRILACALNLASERQFSARRIDTAERHERAEVGSVPGVAATSGVVLVTKDMPLRVKAAAVGLVADEYRAQDVVPSGWTGLADVEVTCSDVVDTLFRDGSVDPAGTELEWVRELPCHTGLRLLGSGTAALGRVAPDKRIKLVRGDREAFGLHGRSAEQRIAL